MGKINDGKIVVGYCDWGQGVYLDGVLIYSNVGPVRADTLLKSLGFDTELKGMHNQDWANSGKEFPLMLDAATAVDLGENEDFEDIPDVGQVAIASDSTASPERDALVEEGRKDAKFLEILYIHEFKIGDWDAEAKILTCYDVNEQPWCLEQMQTQSKIFRLWRDVQESFVVRGIPSFMHRTNFNTDAL
jgi:hypothetical protein